MTLYTISSEWKFGFGKMKVNVFEILLIDFTFYLEHVQKLIFNVLMKYEKKLI